MVRISGLNSDSIVYMENWPNKSDGNQKIPRNILLTIIWRSPVGLSVNVEQNYFLQSLLLLIALLLPKPMQYSALVNCRCLSVPSWVTGKKLDMMICGISQADSDLELWMAMLKSPPLEVFPLKILNSVTFKPKSDQVQ